MKSNNTYNLIRYSLGFYLFAIVVFALFRSLFIYVFYEDFLTIYKTTDTLFPILIKCMGKGLRYDNIVLAYLFIFPLISILFSWFVKIKLNVHLNTLKVYYIVAFAALFVLSCVDIPYYKYFWTHPTIAIFDWLAFKGTYGMILQETSYYPYLMLFVLVMVLLVLYAVKGAKYILKRDKLNGFSKNISVQIILYVLSCIICFFGTRGHLHKDPIGLAAACFTNHSLVQNLCISPAYYFVADIDGYSINVEELMDASTAVEHIRKEYGIIDRDSCNFSNPLSRVVEADTAKTLIKKNVVLVFMESMGASLLGQTVEGKQLTPYLDSLIKKSYYFNNFYSSGIHTNLGVASTLSGMPSRFREHMMSRQPLKYRGILSSLGDAGYYTSFFIPNDEVYDNMGLYLRTNGIDTIFSDNHYKASDVVNSFGVPDDFLYRFSVNEINKFNIEQPFLASILTVSNHPPYVVPEEYEDISLSKELAVIRYADDAISNFMEMASKSSWYDNTIFIFVGDHGKLGNDHTYNMSLDYNHVPLIVYSSSFADAPQVFDQYGGQIDIFPTLMGLLNISYVNNTLGIDLLKEERPYAVFSSDKELGCINDSLFYVFSPRDKSEVLYDRRKMGDGTDYASTYPQEVKAMREYGLSVLSAADYLDRSGLAEVE